MSNHLTMKKLHYGNYNPTSCSQILPSPWGKTEIIQTFDDAAQGSQGVKEDGDIHQQKVLPVLILLRLCQKFYELFHSEVLSVPVLIGQHWRQNCQNISAVHHHMEAADAAPFESWVSGLLMHLFLKKKKENNFSFYL